MRRPLLIAFSLAFIATGAHAQTLKKAAWLVRDQLASRQTIEKACAEAKKSGLDTLLVQVRGRGDAYYQSDFVPRSEALSSAPTNFDPLAMIIDQCKGTKVVAWINAFLVWSGDGSPKSQQHLVNAHTDWILTDADGRKVSQFSKEERGRGWIEGIYADPDSQPYREHLAEVARELVTRYKVSGVHLDFIRYPGPDYGRGGRLGEDFKSRYGVDPRWLPTGFGSFNEKEFLSDDTPEERRMIMAAMLLWADMRASRVDDAVRAVAKAVRKVNPAVEISAAVFPDPGSAAFEKGQDWRGWMRDGLVDALFPMVYFGPAERVGAQLGAIAGETGASGVKTKLWAGLGSYIKDSEEIAREAALAGELAYEGVSLFDLGSTSKKGGLHKYFEKMGEEVGGPGAQMRESLNRSGGAVARAYYRMMEKSTGGEVDLPEILNRREAEFRRFTEELFPRVLAGIEKDGVTLPPWREVRGLFRYIHPLDPPSKRDEQLETCATLLERAKKGEDFSGLAAKSSQDGTRSFGGRVGRVYLGGASPWDGPLSATPVGSFTGVVQAHNGCWVYTVDGAGEGVTMPLAEAGWPVRREALAGGLARELAKEKVGSK